MVFLCGFLSLFLPGLLVQEFGIGVKRKGIGAKRSNIKKIYLPKENQNDLDEIDDYIKEGLDLVLVSNYIEVYKDLFGENNG